MKNKLNLLLYFVKKDLKTKYAGSVLGVMWTFLMPVLQILLFWFVFAGIMKARPYGNAKVPYIYFMLSSYFCWLAFLEGSFRAAGSITENSDIVKKISLPKIILPFTATISSYIPNILGYFIFIVVFCLKVSFSPMVIMVIPLLSLQLIFSLGVGLILSAVLPYVRDIGQLLGQILQGLFFLCPIIYSIDSVPEKLKIIFYFNPMTYFVLSYQKILLMGEFPSARYIGMTVSLAFGTFIGGRYVFNRLKEGFSDVL